MGAARSRDDAARRVRGLLDAVVAVTQDRSLSTMLEQITRAACDLSGARYGALGVIAPDGTLGEVVTHGTSPEQEGRTGRSRQGLGVLGALAADPRAVRLREVGEHPEAHGSPPGHLVMPTFLGVPIRVRGEAFGNIYLTEKEGGLPFTADDQELVSALAAAAGAAITNARLVTQARHRQDWLEASLEIMRQLLAGVGRDDGLQLITDRARQLAGADVVAVLLPDGEEDFVLAAVSGVGLDESGQAARLRGKRGPRHAALSRAVLGQGQPQIIADMRSDPQLRTPPGTPELGPGLAVPLAAGEQVLGVLVVARVPGGARFGEVDLGLASAFARHAALALELSRAQSDRTLLAVYEDRDRIARDLHDVVIQRLFAAGLSLQGLRRHLPPEAQARGEALVGDLDEAIRDLRTAIFSLQQPTDPAGLRVRVLRAASAVAPSLGFDPQVRMDGPLDTVVPDAVSAHLLAVLTEALSNAARHARAHRVTVEVSAGRGLLRLEVSDDGVGLSRRTRTSGLANMEARAQQLGGAWRAESPPGAGTRIVWQVPLPA
ncbi:GAF domain-containing protein [Quadrisphaera sp. DSM 44207]|uniref:sensor histidine kinase n=1 Tax=Quadrisphaera sp. DSM 44207 TaxID=1881057 RepID=UPI0008918434|nr:GAF domain-containing protein [Quadrisphaera sp. DSM 44207]SDQ08094.1 Histidine kinase-, DNA gyrase B-, and HSP90-like ATPase [Quadrisphaera sp. DSM 44207]